MHGVSAPLPLERLEAGQVILVGSDRYVTVDDELAAAFAPGDRLIAVAESGDLLHIPELQYDIAERAVADAVAAFAALEAVGDDQITAFFDAFAARLADDSGDGRRVRRERA